MPAEAPSPTGPSRRAALTLLGSASAAGLLAACTSSAGHSPPASGSAPATAAGGGGSPTSPSTSAARVPPTAADWAALARGLQGRLLRPDDTAYEQAHRLYDPRWDGVRPAAVLQAANAHDVQDAVRFANRYAVTFTARGGGHSYVGASVVADGLVLDLRRLDSVSYDASSASVTAGGGVALIDVYTALAARNRALPGGTCPTVGLAGLLLGGGFGVLDRSLGLTCDRLTEAELVTGDGRRVTVDARREPDLFWALRGGGSGVGILTSARLRTAPATALGRWTASWPWSRAAAVVAGWQRFVGSAGRGSWAGLHLDVLADGTRRVLLLGFCPAGQQAADLAACVRAVGADPASTSASQHSFLDTVLSLAGCPPSGVAACHLPPHGSLGREAFVAGSSVPARSLSPAQIADLVAAVADDGAWTGERHAIGDPLGGAVAAVAPGASAFPWRRSPFTIQWYAKLTGTGSPAAAARAGRWVRSCRTRMRAACPGAYVNYPSADVSDPAVYFGGNWPRLRQIRGQSDPAGVFRNLPVTSG